MIQSYSLAEIELIVELHATFNDYKKIYFWLNTPNPNFGGISPASLIKRGKINKVLEFVRAAAEG